jgi:hypothetical protein
LHFGDFVEGVSPRELKARSLTMRSHLIVLEMVPLEHYPELFVTLFPALDKKLLDESELFKQICYELWV